MSPYSAPAHVLLCEILPHYWKGILEIAVAVLPGPTMRGHETRVIRPLPEANVVPKAPTWCLISSKMRVGTCRDEIT